MGFAGKPEVAHIGLLILPGGHAQQHRGALGGLHQKAVYIIFKQPLEAVGDAAGRAAHTGGQVDDQGMGRVHHNRPGLSSCFFSRRAATA